MGAHHGRDENRCKDADTIESKVHEKPRNRDERSPAQVLPVEKFCIGL